MTRSSTPYSTAPATSFWKKVVARPEVGDVDPMLGSPFRIAPETKVATAGSCFAQNIARHLKNRDCTYYVTEHPHPIYAPVADQFGYNVFSARYGNIYTSRQLVQLMRRVYGRFRPADDIWAEGDRFIDPFRPTIMPGGFASMDEFFQDRLRHYASVRQLFETLEVFVFTLGLTECWISKEDGAAYPLCPGVAGGTYDPDQHEMVNLSVDDVVGDMTEFVESLREINPGANVLLTVSPVPLIATADHQNVLQATTYSKAVLRVAADELSRNLDRVVYFPSYEIIAGSFNRGRYFGQNLRDVTEEGVSHVMRVFFKHFMADLPAAKEARPKAKAVPSVTERLARALCDEELLDLD